MIIKLEPREYYKDQVNNYTSILSKTKSKIRKVSLARLLVFIITTIGIYIAVANKIPILAMLLGLGYIVFIYLVRAHLLLEKKKQWNQALLIINNDELSLLDGKTNGRETGEEYLSSSHPYNEDLDVFGRKSLYQLINRSATACGRIKLAETLNNLISDVKELKLRQKAVSELIDKPQWRQYFQATGHLVKESSEDQKGLIAWSKNYEKRFNKIFFKIMLIINPLMGIGVITLIQLNIFTYSTFFLFLLLPMSIIGTRLGILNKIHIDVSKKSSLLLKYAELFKIISKEDFESVLITDIQRKINGKPSAQLAVRKLAKITKSMDYRLNMLVGFFLNIFFLWDIRQAIRIENWKSKYGVYIDEWFSQLSKIDELQSFAGFAFNFPNSIFPDFTEDDFQVTGTNVKHPFISSDESVGNPINIDDWKQFQIITGANMAGKSTYLRTVGINMLLASTGSVVLADNFSLRPTNIFTGIKTTDSLQDGESYFFAELKRLKELIHRLERGEQLFIILDEVLRGTNSADKQKGSMALITQLIRLKASGIIATHDLALGDLIIDFPENIKNKRFEVEISNNELVFDYKLKEGISQNLNATFLMKKMGITL